MKASRKRKIGNQHTAVGKRLKGLHGVSGRLSGMKPLAAPARVDVRAIRGRLGLSQAAFAAGFALSPRTVQEWEQGRRQPESAVRAYLTVIARNPEAVLEALGPKGATENA